MARWVDLWVTGRWIAALVAGVVTLGGVAVYAQTESGPEPVTVERVIDGDMKNALTAMGVS